MNVLAGAGAIGSVLKGATGLVQALKQPKLSSAQFAALLDRQLELHRGDPAQQHQTQAAAMAQKFMGLRDVDGDSRLGLHESGLDEARFQQLDANRDGFLTAQELSAYAAANMTEAAQVLR
jgi:hypothetical protein